MKPMPITPPRKKRLTFKHRFKIIGPLLAASMLLLTTCGGAGEGLTITQTNYITIVKGKIITPAKAADPAKGAVITTAQVWASTDTNNKVSVNTTDGSYTMIVTHSGTFTLNADYTAADKNYKAATPQTVTTTAKTHTQNITLKYAYTTTLSGRVVVGIAATATNGATIIVSVEGREVARAVSSTIESQAGMYRIKFDHPGNFLTTASVGSGSDRYEATGVTGPTDTYNPLIF